MAEVRNVTAVDEAIQIEADDHGDKFGEFLPQLRAFIDEQTVKPFRDTKTFFLKNMVEKGL